MALMPVGSTSITHKRHSDQKGAGQLPSALLDHSPSIPAMGSAMTIEQHITEVLKSPTASEWLKSALKTALSCEPTDVSNDAQYLSILLARRAQALEPQPSSQAPKALADEIPPRVYDPTLLAFHHEGFEIRNPFRMPDGVTPCEPTYYGFSLDGTGGTGVAWHLYLPDGLMLVVCDNDDGETPADAHTWPEASIGLIDGADEILTWILGQVPGSNAPLP